MDISNQAEFDEGPFGAASDWVDAVLRQGSLAAAWPRTDPELRRELAAAWIATHPDHPLIAEGDTEAMAEKLASAPPAKGLRWSAFERFVIAAFQAQFADVDPDSWCWVVRPSLLALDIESVIFMDVGPLGEDGKPIEPLGPGERPAIAFMMRLVDGSWTVTAVGAPHRSDEAPPDGAALPPPVVPPG